MTQTRAEQIAEKRQFWKQQLDNWKQSGLTQVEYCLRNNLKPHRFTYWKKRYDRIKAPVSLVELSLAPKIQPTTLPKPSAIKLIIADQFCVEIQRDFDPVALQQLIFTLRQI